MKGGFLRQAASACAIASGLMSMSAMAQSAQENAGVADIIVTAQKRAQSLNDVGLTINVATGDQLVNLGVRDTGDLAKISPGLVFTKSQDGTALFTIRGIGFNDYTLGSSPTVSVYVDQVGLPFSQMTTGATLDLERVEVLKGPQGILFGQNSTGGAINYIAAKPTKELEAGFTSSYSRFDLWEASGYISGPVTDTLAVRAAIGTSQGGAWQKNYTRKDSLGDQDVIRGRFQAEWEPTDRLTMLFSINGFRDKSDTQAGQFQGLLLQTSSVPCFCDPVETQRRIDQLLTIPRAPQNARAADWNPELGDDPLQTQRLHLDNTFYQASLRLDYKVTDEITLTSLTSGSKFKQNYGIDRDGLTLIDAESEAHGRVKSFAQELRVAGDTPRLNWLVGANYASNKVVSADSIFTKDATNTAILTAPAPWIARSTTTITQDVKDYAIFGNAEYKVTDQITLLGGARYTWHKNDFTACNRGDGDLGMPATFSFLNLVLGGAASPPLDTFVSCLVLRSPSLAAATGLPANQLILTPFQDKQSEKNFSWRLGANYEPNADTLLYALVTKGYKSGSFPTVPASATDQYSPVKQESVMAYELGAKLSLLDRRVQLNASLFHYLYKNKQVRGLVIDPVFNQLERLLNVPKSRINGAEVELTAQPTEGLTLKGAATWIDSKIIKFTGINNARQAGDFSGSELPFSPKWNLSGDIDYQFPLNESLGGTLGAHFQYNSSTNGTFKLKTDAVAPSSSFIKKFATLDLRAGIRSLDDRWSFMIWGQNVTNTYYWTNQFVTQDVIARYAAKPVTYGATFSFNFR